MHTVLLRLLAVALLASGVAVAAYEFVPRRWRAEAGSSTFKERALRDANESAAIAALRSLHLASRGEGSQLPSWLEFAHAAAQRDTQRSGYCFRVHPGGTGAATAASSDGAWCAYAWPAEPLHSGVRAFRIDALGIVYATPNEDRAYGGPGAGPAADADRDARAWSRLAD